MKICFCFNIIQVYSWLQGKALKPSTSYEDYRFFETYCFEEPVYGSPSPPIEDESTEELSDVDRYVPKNVLLYYAIDY